MAKNTLGLVFFPAFDWMISPGHPERQERLLYTRDQLEEEGLFDCEEIKEYRPRLAEIEDLLSCVRRDITLCVWYTESVVFVLLILKQ